MKIINKIKEILFDEETIEIPVITKEEEVEKPKRVTPKEDDDEVIVHQIESAPMDESLFDMPKLKQEAKEEVKTSTFTFPVFDDEDLDVMEESRFSKPKKEEKSKKYDLLSSLDYIPRGESRERRIDKVESTPSGKKPFVPSPIISPVYGILNENYKKEDIITRDSIRTEEKLDLDSVRRKAYGTLEDEIEVSLTSKKPEVVEEEKEEVKLDSLSDEGISIDDLLMDVSDVEDDGIIIPEQVEEIDEEEIKEVLEDAKEDITLDEENEEIDDDILDEVMEKEEKVEEKEEVIGEEDLFDLIDSLYTRKDEN